LKVVTHVFTPYVVYITAAILIGLFLVQRSGTAKVGRLFGPIMVAWFVAIAGLGLHQVLRTPDILNALNPIYAFEFATQIGFHNFLLAVGAVTLAVTGAESLYADLGHFGKRPIRQGWFYVAFWALALNYLGQGAYLLSGNPINGDNVFFSLIPQLAVPQALIQILPLWVGVHLAFAPLYCMVILATAAAVIASQALITGAFTLASQAMALGMAPRLNIIHTNHKHEGQIYVPAVNWLLMIGCLVLVFVFKSSSNLAAAYGLAVTGVMIATSSSMYQVARYRWKWSLLPATIVFRVFLAIDLTLFTANVLKFFTGGYVPVLVALLLFAFVLTWRWGRDFVRSSYAAYTSYASPKDIAWLVDLKRRLDTKTVLVDRARRIAETDRATVFLVSQPVISITSRLPIIIRIFMKRHGSLPRHVVFLTILQEKKPFVSLPDRIEVVNFGYNILAVKAHFGFMQTPNGLDVLKSLKDQGYMGTEVHRCTVEAAEEELFVGKNARFIDKLRIKVYHFFARISPPAYHYFRFDTKPGLSKTIVPILLGKEGWRIDIPEYALEHDEERVDPDTRQLTDLRFTRTKSLANADLPPVI
jgi:KUP system potassium uptake protein